MKYPIYKATLMAKPFFLFSPYLYLFMVLLPTHHSTQLEDTQSQSVLTIQKLLNYPTSLSSLEYGTDLCNIESSPYFAILCYEDNITQVHFRGIDGIPPLPGNFSINSMFEALAGLPSLKVISLVSLGLWGPLPPSIGKLSSLEILNLSSNYLNGTIPVEFFSLRNVLTVVLDHNMLTGRVPGWLSSLSALTVLSLKNNSFVGSLPSALSGLGNLRILELSMNRFSGEVPDLSNLTNLQVLDLESNSFGPKFPSLYNRVVTLVLRRNRFRFGMTDNIDSYYQLQKMDISLNGFAGPFFPSLLALPSISYLDIAGNKFTGMLLANMSCGGELDFVNLSSNLLTGELPACLESEPRSKIVRYQGNCLSSGDQEQHPRAFCEREARAVKILSPEHKRTRATSKAVLAMSTVGGTLGGISLLGLVLLLIRIVFSKSYFKKPQTRLILENATSKYTSRMFSDAREICQMMKFGPLGFSAYRNFPLEELKEATANFDESNLIGEGCHGPVYKGKLANDTLVAIRSLKMKKRRGAHTYTHHIELLSKLRHNHLVSALGHSFEYNLDDSTVNRIYLVFEFLPNGTLRDWISGKKLTWLQRITAAIGVAKGIQFLNAGIMPGLYTNNVKITDVLLDHDLHVKINRYNLPLFTENMGAVVDADVPSLGSKESLQAMVKQDEKSDVYDFGVILLEIIAGRDIASNNEVDVVKDLFQEGIKADNMGRGSIIHPAAGAECANDSLKTLMELCVGCLSIEPKNRPSIEDVLWNLHFAAQMQDSWQEESPFDKLSPVISSR
ncbi:hypothetical protein Nepgr_013072 [Nepenthes gracilis]|uniref:Protein kinase domain-containing protein n=1 Tax=Nepenthes gracilis TaxID=150966 RepID=A0AAD3SIQ3_NEPGR|nr:hypothetical protein Nepgr_013072 [Nepenthes gracilis]